MDYILHLFITICFYIIIACSLNLLSGYLGIVSIAHAAFIGIGSYVTAILTVSYGVTPAIAIILSVGFTVVFAYLLGIPFFLTHGKDFALVTFAFQMLFNTLTNNLSSLTKGPIGISNIPPTVYFIKNMSYKINFLIIFIPIFLCLFLVILYLSKSIFARLLKAIREDSILVESLGRNVRSIQTTVFVLSVTVTSLIGAFYALYYSHINPISFDFSESVFLLSLIIIGGAGNIWGTVLSSIGLVLLPELLGFLGLSNSIGANLRQIIYSVILIIIMTWRPKGFLGDYSFSKKPNRAR